MISDGHLTYKQFDLFIFVWTFRLILIDIYNNDMIHYLNITSWLLCRCLVLIIVYCFDAWCIIWKKAFDKTFFLFMGGDFTYIYMFIFKFTCKWPAVIKFLLHSLIVLLTRYGILGKVMFSVLISLILVNKVSRLLSGYIKRTQIIKEQSIN